MSTAPEARDYVRFDELAEEFADRYRRGERPNLEEYVGRLPQMADEIREMFRALVEVERAEKDARQEPALASSSRVPSLALVGDYRILREVGRGGMGVVYEAEQISLGRRVALKVLPDHVAGDRKTLERFRREARAAARLHHTNIVPVFEVGRDASVAFYAMQFIQGQGLDQVIDELVRLRDPSHSAINLRASASEGIVAMDLPTATMSGGAGGLAQPRRSPGRIAESLLSGRLAIAEAETPMNNSFRPSGAAVNDQFDTSAARVPAAAQVVEAGPSGSAAQLRPGESAVLPGGTPVSAVGKSRRRLPYFRSVAQIGRQTAQALAYAHARGVVHRDIKPSNLLLDTAGIVWITDFGLAKASDDGLTATGDLLGTLRYMAPERFRGQGDARADIYALGLTLYELLSLRPAFESSDRLKLISQIQTDEPARPRSVDGSIPRDLETIVLKAIDKEPARRYPSASALAEDLRRFLDDEAITARRTTVIERLMKFARRQRAVAALGALFLVAVLVGVAGISWKWREALGNLTLANVQRQSALENLAIAKEQRSVAQLKSREASEKAASLERQLYVNHIQLAQNAWNTESSAAVLDILSRCRPELRDWEWSYLRRLCHLEKLAIGGGRLGLAFSPDGRWVASADRTHRVKVWDTSRGDLVRTQIGHSNSVYSIAFSPVGRLLATGSRDSTIKLWDAPTGELRRTLEPRGSWVRSVAFDRDGTRLVSGSGAEQFAPGKTAELILWDVASGREIRRFAGPHDRIYGVAYRPDGKEIASIDCDASLKLWDPESGALKHRLVGHTNEIDCVAYSPDGRILATAGRDQIAILWDVAEAKILHTLRGHDSSIASLDFSPDGKSLVSADSNAAIKLWDVGRGAEIAHLRNSSGVTGVRFSPTGRQLATVGVDHELKLWEPATFKSVEYRTLGGHRGWCYRSAYTPDGKILATTGWGLVRLWDASTGQHVRDIETGFGSGIYGFAIRSDGRMLAMAQERGPTHIDLFDVQTSRFRRLEGHRATVNCVAFAPGGVILASAGDDMDIRLWDSAGGRTVATLTGHTAAVEALAFSPDGMLLASQGRDSTVRIWDVAKARLIRVHDGVPRGQAPSYGCSLAFSPDGKHLAAARSDGLVTLWDVTTGALIQTLSGHREAVNSVAFLNARRVVTASDDRTVKLWDLDTGENVLTLRGHSGPVLGLACRPDGSQIATTGRDDARVWDTAGSTSARGPEPAAPVSPVAPPPRGGIWPKGVLTGHKSEVNRVAFTPDGQTLVTVSDDTTVRLWEPATVRPRAILRGHHAPVTALAIAPNGSVFATAEGDWQQPRVPAEIKLWDTSSGSCIASWQGHARPIWSLAFSPDGRTLASGSSDGLVKLWNPADQTERGILVFGDYFWVRGLVFTPDGRELASSHQTVVRRWDLAKRAAIADFQGHSREITALALTPDGKILASASRDETVILWDRQSGQRLATVTGNEGWVNDVAFSPDGKTLVLGVMDGSVKLWDVAGRRIKAVEHVRQGSSLGVAFSPDGKSVASGHNPFGILSRVAE